MAKSRTVGSLLLIYKSAFTARGSDGAAWLEKHFESQAGQIPGVTASTLIITITALHMRYWESILVLPFSI